MISLTSTVTILHRQIVPVWQKNNALWSAAFKDATCDLLNGEAAIAGSVPKSVAGGMLICERLEGTLAHFFTFRDDIFDFQFQLVDAIAKVVLATDIKGKNEVLKASELMIGFFMMENRLQSEASLYCDVLEYRLELARKIISACSTNNGLFNNENVEALIAYTDNSRYDEFERDVFIPTRARSDGDTGYIDLPALAKGEPVVFKLPLDNTWLRDYRWTLAAEETIPFVESFKIFLPRKEYPTGTEQQHITTRIVIKSIAGSFVSAASPNTSPNYILPIGHSIVLSQCTKKGSPFVRQKLITLQPL